MKRELALAIAAAALACTRPATPAPAPPDASAERPPTEAADAGTAAAPPAPPAALPPAPGGGPTAPTAPAALAAAPVTAALARVGAATVPLQREGVTALDPGSAFELEVAAHLADGRLSLRDEADAMVASTGTSELGEGTSRYRLVPDEPLRPGSRYTLHLDGAVTRELHGADGHPFAPVVLQLKTTGERPAPAQGKRRGSRR